MECLVSRRVPASLSYDSVNVLRRLPLSGTKECRIKHLGDDPPRRGEQNSSESENSMLPVVQIVLILETEKSSLERFDRGFVPLRCRRPGMAPATKVRCSLPTSALVACSAGISGTSVSHSGDAFPFATDGEFACARRCWSRTLSKGRDLGRSFTRHPRPLSSPLNSSQIFDVARFTRSRLAVSFHYIIQIFNKFQDITPIATRDRLLRQSRRRRQGAWQ